MQCGPRPRILVTAYDAQNGELVATLEVTDRSLADARDPADPNLPDHIRIGRDKKARHAFISARLLRVENADQVRWDYARVDKVAVEV